MAVVDVGQQERSEIRDAVTGERLTDARTGKLLPSAGQRFIRVREDRIEAAFTAVERTPIPRAIDTAQPYPGGALGGKRWHPEFQRYIGDLRPRAVEEADCVHREWWRDAYARARVLRGFIGRYGPERGAERCAVALASLDQESAALAVTAGEHSAWWIGQRVSEAYHFAFEKRFEKPREKRGAA